MSSARKLLIGVTCTARDISIFHARLERSLRNFIDVFRDDVFIYVVLQAASAGSKDIEFTNINSNQIKINKPAYQSTSAARNSIIDFSYQNNFTNLIFHDVSILYSSEFCSWVSTNIGDSLISGKVKFSEESVVKRCGSESRMTYFNPVRDTYVFGFVFPTCYFIPYFDANYGPGTETKFKCGEDMIFMCQFMKNNINAQRFLHLNTPCIFHPARPRDYSKHLEYAFCQGHVFRRILKEYWSIKLIIPVVLFFASAIVRILFNKPNSLLILKLRIRGFIK